MTFHPIRNTLAGLAIAAAAIACQTAPSAAQDLNAMNNAFNAQMNGAMQQRYQGEYAQLMQNPQFHAMYRQHRIQGGQLSVEQFAYQYMATGGFSPQGMANYRNSQRAIEEQQRQGMEGLRAAEEARARAQRGYMDGGHAIRQEGGNGLQGRGTYIDAYGQQRVMPNTQPGVVQQDSQGNRYVMDGRGQYYMATPYGWQPIQPRY